ncbi:MAG TPA: hypothetical protein VF548_04675 [Allosphingosinicella sp.]|jgi:hypothetical protein
MRTIASAAAFALSLAAAAVFAQEHPERGDSPTITVTGVRDVEKEAREFVGAITPAAMNGNIARFETNVCPRVIGAAPGPAALMEERLRTIAKAAGLLLGKEGCRPNALMVITADKRALIRTLQKQGNYFGDRTNLSKVRRLARDPGPTAFWRLDGFVTAFGTPLAGNAGEPIDYRKNNSRASRISTGTRLAVDGATLIVEARAIDGLTPIQLADYGAMRLYGFADPADVTGSAPTILKVLTAEMGSETPITMTRWDLSFLRGLYASGESLRAPAQRSEIRRRLLRELNRATETEQK